MSSLKDRIQRLRTTKGRVAQQEPQEHAPVEIRKPEMKAAADQSVYKTERRPMSIDREKYVALQNDIRQKLLDLVDLSVLKDLNQKEVVNHIRKLTEQLLDKTSVVFNRREREQFLKEMVDDLVGFGPLEVLLSDPTVSDILVNGSKQVYVERSGKLQLSDVQFKSNKHLRQVIDRIVSLVGRHVDEAAPMCDARLPDGSRVNVIIPPLAVDYPSLSIRKFMADVLSVDDLVRYGAFSEEVAIVVEAAVRCRLNILISGGTGSGKTTLLNVLSGFIPANERIVTIEDSAELQLQQPHVVRLETRPPNIEGKGEVTQFDLLRNSLRMRPDRIILGEVRGREALDMLQAMNTGHDGSMSTVHANSPRDALSRLETMIAMCGIELPQRAMRQQIASAIDIIVQQQRLSDGSRKMVYLSEVLDMEGDMVTMQDIFVFDRKGIDREQNVVGGHVATGVQPRFVQRLRASGVSLPPQIFMPAK